MKHGNYGPGNTNMNVPIINASKISNTSWLNDPEYANFVAGYEYASTQTRAIHGLSKITPEEAYFIYEAIKRGGGLSNHEKFGN